MDKNTFIAIILSVVVIVGGFVLQGIFVKPQAEAEPNYTASPSETEVAEPSSQESSTPAASTVINAVQEIDSNVVYEERTFENSLFTITFSNKGASVTSIKLKEHLDNEQPLEMILRGTEEQSAFNMYFGDANGTKLDGLFQFGNVEKDYDGNIKSVQFVKEFLSVTDVPFKMTKTYHFMPDEYMIEIRVKIENSTNDVPVLSDSDYSYTLEMGPQIGPSFTKLDGRKEYRQYLTYANGEKETYKDAKKLNEAEKSVSWSGIVGKYFTVISIPGSNNIDSYFSAEDEEGLIASSKILLSRKTLKSSVDEDVFRFYIGPKTNRDLSRYNQSDDNGFSLSGLSLAQALDTGSILGWLEWLLKQGLMLIYKVIPNYGVAIIILTIVIKALLFPLTRKSLHSTSKMQSLNPKMAEIREKYKSNPNKMNAELAALYKKEGVNPLGGCLPMLLQMPILFAVYGLLNKHFDLRGAGFMLWMNDLSAPDAIFEFSKTYNLLIWKLSAIRILPIIYVVSQIFSTKMMQTPETSGNTQMKMMQYMMPAIFFFILYDMPSGLLLYWIVMNVVTLVQQKYITYNMKRKKA